MNFSDELDGKIGALMEEYGVGSFFVAYCDDSKKENGDEINMSSLLHGYPLNIAQMINAALIENPSLLVAMSVVLGQTAQDMDVADTDETLQ